MITKNTGSFGFLNQDTMTPLPIQLLDFGLEHRQNENYTYSNDKRPNYTGCLLQFTLGGEGCFQSKDTLYTLKKGDCFLVTFPDESYYYLDAEKNWTYFYVHFDGYCAKDIVHEVQRRMGLCFSLGSHSQTEQYFIEEYNAVYRGKKYRPYEAGQWIYTLLSTLLRETEQVLTDSTGAIAELATQWILRNYKKDKNLSDMSAELGISHEHISREFRKYQGISPSDFLQNVRIEQSMGDLLNTNLTIEEIAKRSGFSCGNYFSKAFRKKTGLTPSAYRLNLRS